MKQRIAVFAAFPFLASFVAHGAQEHAGPAPESFVRISYPQKNWAVEIDSPGFAVKIRETRPDGRQYLVADNSGTGLVLSVTLEQSKKPADAATCPAYLRGRVRSMSQLKPVDVKESQVNGLDTIEFLVPKAQGVPVDQKNFMACTAKDGVFVDIHLSKVKFQAEDEPLFGNVLKQFRFSDLPTDSAVPSAGAGAPVTATRSAPTSEDFFREGSKLYIMEDYSGAIGPYQKALDLEKQSRDLPHTEWLVLIDNLGMAYGMTGDLDNAQKTFEYGIRKEPKYPLFYYNLACTYGERKNMERAMDFLKTAFDLKANVIPGETMPDPRRDDSFREFMKDKKFRDFVDSLVSAH